MNDLFRALFDEHPNMEAFIERLVQMSEANELDLSKVQIIITRKTADAFIYKLGVSYLGGEDVKPPKCTCIDGEHFMNGCRRFIFNEILRVGSRFFDCVLGAQLLGHKKIRFNQGFQFQHILILKLINLMQRVHCLIWKPKKHRIFQEDQRMAIFTVMCCANRADNVLHTLPYELLFKIFEWICCPPFFVQKRCMYCRKISRCSRCSRCKVAFFCNRECQLSCKDSHRLLCDKVHALNVAGVADAVDAADGADGADIFTNENKLCQLYTEMLYGKHPLLK